MLSRPTTPTTTSAHNYQSLTLLSHSRTIPPQMITRSICLIGIVPNSCLSTPTFKAIRLLCNSNLAAVGLPLVRAIHSLCTRGLIEFQWIPREGNMMADAMSKLSTTQQFQLSLFDFVLRSIQPLLDGDIDGPPCRRHAHP
ncbi:hypothetical protein V6N12_058046 [Hibiscus sabdariffa]|uniref:RNase H type-1 domain-containing protein n=1 Tax=Hibiscus sabdariffa TaxID=183260 RepID=A0ABR2BCT5_9ROSI